MKRKGFKIYGKITKAILKRLPRYPALSLPFLEKLIRVLINTGDLKFNPTKILRKEELSRSHIDLMTSAVLI